MIATYVIVWLKLNLTMSENRLTESRESLAKYITSLDKKSKEDVIKYRSLIALKLNDKIAAHLIKSINIDESKFLNKLGLNLPILSETLSSSLKINNILKGFYKKTLSQDFCLLVGGTSGLGKYYSTSYKSGCF